MNLKNAIIYRADVPEAQHLRLNLEAHRFTEPAPQALDSVGFVPRIGKEGDDLVCEFGGGLAFAVRLSDKIIPSSAVQEVVDRQVAAFERDTGRKPSRKIRKEFKDYAYAELLPRALTRTAQITCLYDTASRTLVIATTSKRHADRITSLLVKAVESLKTETIHVSSVAHGLTTRLTRWLADSGGDAFGDNFYPCNSATLVDSMKRKVEVKMNALETAREGLQKALAQGFSVTSIGLMDGMGFNFRLTDKFRLCAMDHPLDVDSIDADVESEFFAYEARHKLSNIVRTIDTLCEMLAYVAPKADEDRADEE